MNNKSLISKSVYLSLIICLLAALVLVACEQTPPKPPTTTTPPVATGPKMGGILKIGTGLDAGHLGDPPQNTTVQDSMISKTCIESLGRYDAQGVMQPFLAEGWKTDAATKTITVTLKRGIKFHDLTDFNATACKWNLEHFMLTRSELPKGTKVDVVDDYTVRLTLPAWDNTALMGMGYYAGPMVSPTAWQKAPGATDKDKNDYIMVNPVGTGPFQFVSWQKTVKQTYKKFPNYWQAGKPYLDGLEWNFIADPLVLMASFKSKEQDIMYLMAPLNARDLKAAGGINIVALNTGLGLQQTSVWYNSIIPTSPFNNLKVRQAISYATDAKAIVDSLFYGYATTINQWAVPTSQWNNPNYKGYTFDPAKAKALLAEAGFAGLKTKMLTLNDPLQVQIATALQGMYKAAGIDLQLDVVDNSKYRALTSPGGSFTEMCLASQRANSDPAIIWPRNLSDSGVIMNKTIIHPEKIEKMMVDAKLAPDQESKKKIILELQQIIFGEYCIFTPLYVPSGLAAKQTYSKGDGVMDIEYTQWTPETAWLDK